MENGMVQVLLTDRNPNVRDLLCRQLISIGFTTLQARNGQEVCFHLTSANTVDIVVLDPEIALGSCLTNPRSLASLTTRVPFVLHVFPTWEFNDELAEYAAAIVEKGGNTDMLLSTVKSLSKTPGLKAGSSERL